jgi:hypothetical protein
VADLLGPGSHPDVHDAAARGAVARRPDRQSHLVGAGDHLVGEFALPRADPLDAHLGDHVEAALREEDDGRRRRPVLEPPRGRVILEVLEVERERLRRREPARHARPQRRQELAARALDRYSTRFTMTSAVRSSIAAR